MASSRRPPCAPRPPSCSCATHPGQCLVSASAGWGAVGDPPAPCPTQQYRLPALSPRFHLFQLHSGNAGIIAPFPSNLIGEGGGSPVQPASLGSLAAFGLATDSTDAPLTRARLREPIGLGHSAVIRRPRLPYVGPDRYGERWVGGGTERGGYAVSLSDAVPRTGGWRQGAGRWQPPKAQLHHLLQGCCAGGLWRLRLSCGSWFACACGGRDTLAQCVGHVA